MAAWPVAFEQAIKETARRHFPDSEFSIYIHGHSTGGPFAMMASQRVPNIAGLVGYGSSPFGWMYPLISGDDWEFPFNQLRLRTWRDTARYMHDGRRIRSRLVYFAVDDCFIGRLEPGFLVPIAAVEIGDNNIARLGKKQTGFFRSAAADQHVLFIEASADVARGFFEHDQTPRRT